MRILLYLIAFSFFSITGATNAQASPFEGIWLTQNKRSVIEIKKCDEGLCGYVHWVIKGGLQNDIHNPDPELRPRPICGLKILWGFQQDSDKKWSDGTIYKADEGDVYDAYLELLSQNRLKLRGYVGVSLLGKTQVWQRIDGTSSFKKCDPKDAPTVILEKPSIKKSHPNSRVAPLKSE